MTDNDHETKYTTLGTVRGSCGHNHKTIQAAYNCLRKDQKDVNSLGGGAYSDRIIVRASMEELDGDEREELDQIEISDDEF